MVQSCHSCVLCMRFCWDMLDFTVFPVIHSIRLTRLNTKKRDYGAVEADRITCLLAASKFPDFGWSPSNWLSANEERVFILGRFSHSFRSAASLKDLDNTNSLTSLLLIYLSDSATPRPILHRRCRRHLFGETQSDRGFLLSAFARDARCTRSGNTAGSPSSSAGRSWSREPPSSHSRYHLLLPHRRMVPETERLLQSGMVGGMVRR